MENFVLYEELRQDSHSRSVVYKGRRRGTIEFVAIQCTEKCCRDQVTNSVRILHTFDHPNVVRFYEWYETDNHLWCIVELCTGGLVEDVIVQDGHLPEESIREFGVDMLAGLSYIHSMGVVLCDLNPAKMILDSNGLLKYFDFANARLPSHLNEQDEGADYDPDETEAEPMGNRTMKQQERYGLTHKQMRTGSEPVVGNPLYMAPEVVQGELCSSASDLWSLGVVLYELYYGIPPFSGQTFEEVLHRTLNEEIDEFPTVEGELPPSQQFQDLLSGLLIKDPTKRLTWPQLVAHPFWGDSLLLSGSEACRSSIEGRKYETSQQVMGQDGRPHTAPFQHGAIVGDATFTLSGARPHTALPLRTMKMPEQQSKRQFNGQGQEKEMEASPSSQEDQAIEIQNSDETPPGVHELLFHSSDVAVLPIFGNSKIHKMPSLKWESKALPFQAIEVDALKQMDTAALDGHLIVIERALVSSSASSSETASPRVAVHSSRAASSGAGSRGRLHVAAYLYHACQDTDLANHIVNSPLFGVVLSLLKGAKTPPELKFRLVMILGSLARYSTLISQDLDLSEVLTVLSELLKENNRNVEIKQVLLAALGEFLFYVGTEEQREGKALPRWKVSPSLFNVIVRFLKEGETAATHHHAVRTIMNMASTGRRQCEPFTTCDTVLTLWTVYLNSKHDALKAVTLSAMCRLIRFDPLLGQHLLERVGLQTVVSLLASSHSKFQQPVITLFNTMLANNVAARKILMDKDFLSNAVQLLEHPSCVLRGKAYLTVALSSGHSSETLLSCCHLRLVSYIERDTRRQASQSKSLDNSALYLIHCLDHLTATILELIPQITGGIVECLAAVAGRKHPSTAQSKLLRANLPLLPILGYFTSSSVFASDMLTESFLKSLRVLLSHAAQIDCGDAGLGLNAGLSAADFCDRVFDILQACFSASHFVIKHTEIIMLELLPSVALFLQGRHLDGRQALAAGLIGDVLHRLLTEVDREVYCKGLEGFVNDCLLPCLPELMKHAGTSRLAAVQLLAVLIESNSSDILAQFAGDANVIHLLMNMMQECASNVQCPSFPLLMTIISRISTSSHLDRDILYSSKFFSHLVSSLDHLAAAISNQSQRQAQQQQQQVVSSMVPTLECLSMQLEYLLVIQQQLEQVGERRQVDDWMADHSELLLCIPSLFQLICLEDIFQSVAQCLLLMLRLYSQQFRPQVESKEMKCVVSALDSARSVEQEGVVLSIVKGLISHHIVQDAGHVQADDLKQLKHVVLKLQKRTTDKHIKQLTVDVLQFLSEGY